MFVDKSKDLFTGTAGNTLTDKAGKYEWLFSFVKIIAHMSQMKLFIVVKACIDFIGVIEL